MTTIKNPPREYLLWEEDDAMPHDRERLQDAWLRLFGVPMPDPDTAGEKFDDTDVLYLFFGDRVAAISYPGNSAIYSYNKDDLKKR